ncbi:DUF3306 domain-containing protein [Variovorax sp. JS1663]|uniref:DUF3306 domain-containing protein n=1 Tax=Variovorax sp. JS1663 TaxID=1851577 RepID=UPI000B3447DB|nr:DUF3306 domain-containing protein [Variovorax sp. JS1663]OUM02395.1 hypothetical protein A8M77_10470 [Variovorax sp. JS1663]OUM02520.1 hypothetical protein A8M77_11175 [Variovorax sp. JS1663]
MSEGFFERWSRRKQQVREGEVPEEPEKVLPAAAPVAEGASPHPGLPPEGEGEKPAPLTLVDTEALTPESDFKPFLAGDVAPEVKNAALKKLFADPRFNVMDGLDTYIDDYSQSTPVPESVLRQMASAKFMKLFEAQPDKDPENDAGPDVAQSNSMDPVPSQPVAPDAQPASQEADDHHADLRLQQDDAPGAEDPRRGAG